MDSEVKAQNIALNQFCKRMNEQYHAYAVHCGLSDPALWVLYSLWEADTILTQNDICSLWMYPKQTINFTISGLVKKGLVQLEQRPGARSGKAVRLTAAGEAFCHKAITPLLMAEERSLLQLADSDRRTLVALSENSASFLNGSCKAFCSAPKNDQSFIERTFHGKAKNPII